MMRKSLKSENNFLYQSHGKKPPSRGAGGLGQSGQAMVEYVLMIVVALSILIVVSSGLKKTVIALWSYYFQKVSAACPTGCQPDPRYKF
jgi:hypothetical protein